MLSRAADAVYWMNRYVERAENVARFIDVYHNLTLGGEDNAADQWSPLIDASGDHTVFAQQYGEPTRENVLKFLTFDTNNPNSILSSIARARENGRAVREVMSAAMWEELNKFYFLVTNAWRYEEVLHDIPSFCNQVKLASHALLGVTYSTMSHGEAWNFARIGRMIERADNTSRILDVQYYLLQPESGAIHGSLDVVRWSALLRSTTALEMYRREHGKIVPLKVVDFLILDRSFPRSIHFCVIHAEESLRRITGNPVGTFRLRCEQLLGRLRAELDYTGIQDILDRGLHEFIDTFQTQLNQVGMAIQHDFFTIPDSAQRLKGAITALT
ncbi:MAG: alpha-E domain-containing protein [Pirellulales bacterium]